MKLSITCILLAGAVASAFGQTGRTEIPTASGRISMPQSRPFPAASKPAAVSTVNAENEYRQLLLRADNFYDHKLYVEAVDAYEKALARKSEQYPKDQIMRAEAEMYSEQRAREQEKKDRLLRSEAELARSKADQLEKMRADSASRAKSVPYEIPTVHFTGAVISDHYSVTGIAKLFDIKDANSDFLSPGRYDSLTPFLLRSNEQTFDGIAVPPGIRVTIFSEHNLNGFVLLYVDGPAIINNGIWEKHKWYDQINTETYDSEELQTRYPQSVRSWSKSDMHHWISGSMKIEVIAR